MASAPTSTRGNAQEAAHHRRASLLGINVPGHPRAVSWWFGTGMYIVTTNKPTPTQHQPNAAEGAHALS